MNFRYSLDADDIEEENFISFFYHYFLYIFHGRVSGGRFVNSEEPFSFDLKL